MYTVFYMRKRVTAHTPRRFGLFIWRKKITNRESAAVEITEKTQDPGPAVVLLVVSRGSKRFSH